MTVRVKAGAERDRGRQDGRQLAADLHGLLNAAHVPPPYVLAGHSVGGPYALVYAARYPEQVAGVALIDSSTPYMFELLPDYPSFYSMWRRGSAVLPTLARTGLGRLTLRSGSGGLPAQARESARDFASSPRELRGDRNDFLMLPTVFDQAKQLKSLNGKPLAVLTAGSGSQRGWTDCAEQTRATLDQQHPSHRTRRHPRRAARRSPVRNDHSRRSLGTSPRLPDEPLGAGVHKGTKEHRVGAPTSAGRPADLTPERPATGCWAPLLSSTCVFGGCESSVLGARPTWGFGRAPSSSS